MTRLNESAQSWLVAFFSKASAVVGSVHFHENRGLRLPTFQNIPGKVREIVSSVPYVKGMAGLALARGEPVQTRNLREGRSGTVKPGARAVDARAAVVMPVRDEYGSIIAVLGAAFADDHQIACAELERLQGACRSLARLLEGVSM